MGILLDPLLTKQKHHPMNNSFFSFDHLKNIKILNDNANCI